MLGSMTEVCIKYEGTSFTGRTCLNVYSAVQ